MSDFFDKVKRSVNAFKNSYGPGCYRAGGIHVSCPHCKNDVFEQGSALLNTSGMTFLDLDWLNKSATVLSCTNCGFIQWYGKAPERID